MTAFRLKIPRFTVRPIFRLFFTFSGIKKLCCQRIPFSTEYERLCGSGCLLRAEVGENNSAANAPRNILLINPAEFSVFWFVFNDRK